MCRDSQKLPNLGLRGQDRGGKHRTQALVAKAQQNVLHKRIDRGAAGDALTVQVSVGTASASSSTVNTRWSGTS